MKGKKGTCINGWETTEQKGGLLKGDRGMEGERGRERERERERMKDRGRDWEGQNCQGRRLTVMPAPRSGERDCSVSSLETVEEEVIREDG